MTDKQPEDGFTNTMHKAAAIVGEGLFPAALKGLDALAEAINELSGPQIRAALVWTVLFDREQQRDEKVTYTIDVAALDALATAAESGVAEIRDVVLELPEETAAEALGELVYLHREIKVTEAVARTSATLN